MGDTYNTAIGQYGVQVTPLEMARAVGGVAERGVMVTPHVFKNDSTEATSTDLVTPTQTVTDMPDDEYSVIQAGMRLSATVGTGKMFAGLPFTVGSKTGTAQVGVNGTFINGWVTDFFPYEDPHYALVIMLEHGTQNIGTATRIGYDFLDWVRVNAPEYTK